MQADPLPPRKAQKKPWELLFDPDLLLEEHEELLVADFSLSEEELKQWALNCTKLRASFREQAMLSRPAQQDQDGEEDHVIDRLAKSIEKSQHSASKRMTKLLNEDVIDTTPIGLRKRRKRRPKLTTL